MNLIFGSGLLILVGMSLLSYLPTTLNNFVAKESEYSDTTGCKTKQVSKEEFVYVLNQKIKQIDIPIANIAVSDNDYSLAYFKYMRSSGFYIYYQVLIDSSGIVKEFILKQNVYSGDKYPFKIKKRIARINACVFTNENVDSKFLINNCFVSDGSDDFFFTIRNGQLLSGTNAIVNLMGSNEKNLNSCFIRKVADLYEAILKYGK